MTLSKSHSLKTLSTLERTQLNAKVAELFREKREELGFSIRVVADYLNVTPEVLLAYESGLRPIPVMHIYAFANCLGVSTEVVQMILDQLTDGPVLS